MMSRACCPLRRSVRAPAMPVSLSFGARDASSGCSLRDWQTLVRACSEADIAVSDRWLPRSCTPRWLKLDRKALAQTGGVAIYLEAKPRVQTVSERLGEHPWAM